MTVDPNKQYTTTRMLPRSVLKIKQKEPVKPVAAVIEEEPPKTPSQSKFSKRFNMLGGSSSSNLERS